MKRLIENIHTNEIDNILLMLEYSYSIMDLLVVMHKKTIPPEKTI
jgi:hypothetical protein